LFWWVWFFVCGGFCWWIETEEKLIEKTGHVTLAGEVLGTQIRGGQAIVRSGITKAKGVSRRRSHEQKVLEGQGKIGYVQLGLRAKREISGTLTV